MRQEEGTGGNAEGRTLMAGDSGVSMGKQQPRSREEQCVTRTVCDGDSV